MNKYIALLRGINISGKNQISMSELKVALEAIDFQDVVTYINSGNVVFSSACHDQHELIRKCEAVIEDRFALKIPVTIISANDLSDVLSNAPSWWNVSKEDVNYAIFVIAPTSIEEVFAAVGEIRPEYEKIAHHKNVIFWSAPLKIFNKARWSKIASSSVNNNVTIRNANTVHKLMLLSE